MSEFTFIDDDPRNFGSVTCGSDSVIAEFADALRANPGKWAVYPEKQSGGPAASNLACRINGAPIPPAYRINGASILPPAPFTTGGFEAVARQGVVYVRYVGAAS